MTNVIMSVQEIIDTAFPDVNANCTINFKLLKTLVVILANQLRVLNRHVQVDLESGLKYPETHLRPSLQVSEVKIQVDDENKDKSRERKREDTKRKDAGKRVDEKQVEKRKEKASKEMRESQGGQNVGTSKNFVVSDLSVRSTKAEVLQEGATIRKTTADDLEILRERELRTIDQRADSHEYNSRTPSPMASAHSLGKDNLLVVSSHGRTPKINVVTKEQFDELVKAVHDLKTRFDPVGIPGFPDNADFLNALRRGASLTEAMAALQISARLEAFENAFKIMMSLLTELARKAPGVDVSHFQDLEKKINQGGFLGETSKPVKAKCVTDNADGANDWVPRDEFNNAMHKLYDEIIQKIEKSNNPRESDSKRTEVLLKDFEQKLESISYTDRIEAIEGEISEFAKKLVNLDIGLSSQIGIYQEQLTQLQYQLETGLEHITDRVVAVHSDPEPRAELNMRLSALQQEVDNAVFAQNNLSSYQNNMTCDLARITKEIEMIRDAKADRDEVDDKLRDKAGIENLNGMVSVDQFVSSFDELKKLINASYAKLKKQEHVWQMAIDDLTKLINQKGDWLQISYLRDDINHHLNNLQDQIDTLVKLVGEPRAAAVRKKLFNDTNCACCGNPAGMNMEVHVSKLPEFKRTAAENKEDSNIPKDDGDHGPCIPDHPLPMDLKGHLCKRYCGGSHTLIPTASRAPLGVTITGLQRKLTTTVGSDGKAYKTDEPLHPCGRCNMSEVILEPVVTDVVSSRIPDVETNNLSLDASEMAWLGVPKNKNDSEIRLYN